MSVHLHCDNSETGRRITIIDRETKKQFTGVVICNIEDDIGDAHIVKIDNSESYQRISTYSDRWWYTHDRDFPGAYVNKNSCVKS